MSLGTARKTRMAGAEKRRLPVRSQREVLRDVLASAALCGAWLTLQELSTMTQYPHASISAQLRHLRKVQFGSHVVEKRRRIMDELLCRSPHGAIWEYKLASN